MNFLRLLLFLLLPAQPLLVLAGGSGMNVVVVVNQNSTNSVQLGNYYCEQRAVPPQNLLRIHWSGSGSNAFWTRTEFDTNLAIPLQNMISNRGLTNQINYVVLSMDIPYRVTSTNGMNSTTAALFYGFKADDPAPGPGFPNSCSLPSASFNAYAGSEDLFRSVAPGSGTNTFLVTLLTAHTLPLAKAIVNQATLSDGTFPTQVVVLAKSFDVNRNFRHWVFDKAVFNARVRGNYSLVRSNLTYPTGLANMLGFETGVQIFSIFPDSFVPGAMADSLTSFGGVLYEPNDHTTLLAFIEAGAVGSYGTVVEPCGYPQKFPSPLVYFYQARGFNMAECYYQSVTNPYQGLIVGEPLAAPFASPPDGLWSNTTPDLLLSGTTNLSLHFASSDPSLPVQKIELFVDGTYLQTLTNVAPRQNNVLFVTLPGKTNMSYTVPSSATIKSIASGLTAVLNTPANSNTTKVVAYPRGDRIDLVSTDTNRSGADTYISISNSVGTAAVLTTFVHTSRSNFLDSIASGHRIFTIGGTVDIGDHLQLTVVQTNNNVITVALTNIASGVTLNQFIQQFMNAINATASLQGNDGVVAEDLLQSGSISWDFTVRARGQGYRAAEVQAQVSGTFSISPGILQKLTQNLSDLRPRNHLYITAGATNLPLTFAFDSTMQPNGFHELTAVGYEGSHVQTARRISRTVRIQNGALSAVFNTLVGDTNAAVEGTLQFSVVANTNSITSIELFSTGGSLGVVLSQSNAVFSVAGTNLSLGLHPFYAIVTRADGKQYRTETKWIRLVGPDDPFSLRITHPPPTILWPATAGRKYDILSATNVTDSFELRSTVIPTNSAGHYLETNGSSPKRFYRLRSSS